MFEVVFLYRGQNSIIQCNLNDKMKDIIKRFEMKLGKDINSLYFIYGGKKLEEELTLEENINKDDIKLNKINIIVNDIDKEEEEEINKKSKEIICPICKESIKMKIYNYKIYLNECKNNHKIGNILMKDFESKQYINQNEIICNNCKINNKSKTYKNEFYICNTCKIYLCPLCKKGKHDKNHNIINYEDKYYICDKHNNKYNSYCMECKKDICILCEQEHNNHEMINDGKLIPKIDEYKNKLNELRESIDKLKENINGIIDNLNKVIENIEIYYTISNEIINNYDNKNINYEILYNINEININNENIIKDINNINNDKNINNKFKQINNIYNKIFNDEITIIYNIKDKEDEIKIFDSDFVKNNKDKCKIIYDDEIYDLTEYFKINKNDDKLKILLKGISNITNMSDMFYRCSSLSSLPDISNWNTSNVTNMNGMFFYCSSLSSLPDISNWNTSNVTNMRSMFRECSSLSSLPDISNWNTSNVTDMSYMFCDCSSLSSLPDISNWNIKNLKDKDEMFEGCKKSLNIPSQFKKKKLFGLL